MIKKTIFVVIFVIVLVLSFGSLGRFFDVSEDAKYVDVIVSLGGSNGARIKKTLDLYENNMSKTGKIILTGVNNFDPDMKIYELDWRASYLEKNGIKKDNIVFNSDTKNTLEEIVFIKQYMIDNNIHSVMFITDAPHSRRISFFASNVAKYQDSELNYVIVGTENDWWDKDKYYVNPKAIIFIINESIKFTYYYIQNVLGKVDLK